MAKKELIPSEIKQGIEAVLEDIFELALHKYNAEKEIIHVLPADVIEHLDKLTEKAETASAAFTNIITGLAIKIWEPELDVRFHQIQIQANSALGKSWFNHRGLSEKVVYPWLSQKNFAGAKSGWQTRTLERPKPYTRDYDENISYVKEAFLEIYESTNERNVDDIKSELAYLLYRQLAIREGRVIDLATPNIDVISTIIGHFKAHINYKYAGKGASRLPVLAVFATLKLVSKEISRYENVELKDLEEHSAADSQTGSAGDIEFADSSGKVFEALEIKHNILVDKAMISDAEKKISPFQLDRYYVLTTAENCTPDLEMTNYLSQIQTRIGCQVIVNGVFPSIQYYLRLVKDPSEVYKLYTQLLAVDSSVTHEHRETWNQIILG